MRAKLIFSKLREQPHVVELDLRGIAHHVFFLFFSLFPFCFFSPLSGFHSDFKALGFKSSLFLCLFSKNQQFHLILRRGWV